MVDPTPEQAREVWELNKQAAERAHKRSDKYVAEAMKAILTNAETVIRSLILINGAAAISIMTFLGALAAKPSVSAVQIVPIATGLEWFAVGALAAALTACFAYLANSSYVGEKVNMSRDHEHPYEHSTKPSKRLHRWALAWHGLAVAATIVSLGAFAGGIWFVSGGVKAISLAGR
jgi:hypothetical protein